MFKKKKSTEIKIESTPFIDTGDDFSIKSAEERFKQDGVVVLANINQDKTITPTNATKPNSINIDERIRIKELQKKSKEKISTNIDYEKQQKKALSLFSLFVLLGFAFVGGFFYYRNYKANQLAFKTKDVQVELGDPIPTYVGDYIYIEQPDEKQYILDNSEVIFDKVGTYTYKVTYQGSTRTGTLTISDTTPPEPELINLTLASGSVYTPEMFVSSCSDYTNCIVTFEDGDTLKTASTIGNEKIFLVLKDSFGNQTTKQASLTTVDNTTTLVCTKSEVMNFNTGTRNYNVYTLLFDKNEIYLSGTYTDYISYLSATKYQSLKDEDVDKTNVYDDNELAIGQRKEYTEGFGKKNTKIDIKQILEDKGYTCK